MEEDIKELTRLYDIAEVVLPKYSTEKIKYVISEKQRIALKNLINRLKEDEAVIKEMINYIGMNTNVEIKKCPFRENLKCKDRCKNCIEQYFREKVKDE